MAVLQFDPIRLDGFDQNNIQKLNSWIMRLIEYLSYILNNIDDSNMTEDAGKQLMKAQEILRTIAEAKEKIQSLNDTIREMGNKLDGIADGAEVNVQADWKETDSGSDAFIKNKPTIPSVGNATVTIKQDGKTKGSFTMNQSGDITIELTDSNTTYGTATKSADGLMASDDKKKLDGIANGAEVNVQADWEETDSGSDAFIKNKPTIQSVGNGTVTIKQAGITKGTFTMNQSGNVTIELTDSNTTYSPSTTTPKANGTASVGTEAGYARGDHVHPLQTSVSGKAGSATKLATARKIDGVSFDGSADIVHYGSCSTAAATAAKVVDLTGFTLVTGAVVQIKFTVTNTAANPTLNVNSTGAKAIYYRGSAITAGYLAANRTYEFVYNGTQYELVGDIDTNTNTWRGIQNNLTSDSTTDSLSAKQGKVLKEYRDWKRIFKNRSGLSTSAALTIASASIFSSGCNEILIQIGVYNSSKYWAYSITVDPSSIGMGDGVRYMVGYSWGTPHGVACVTVSRTNITLEYVVLEGTNLTTNSMTSLTVSYR